MFKPFLTLTTNVVRKKKNTDKIVAALKELAHSQVLVGIPSEKSGRNKSAINNAELGYILEHGVGKKSTAVDGYIHEKGDPAYRISPRPFLAPSIEANKDAIRRQQAKILKLALAGDTAGVETELNALGLMGQNFVRAWFVDPRNNWAPNAPYTIAKKGSDRPNIDTGQLRRSITYVIREE